MNQPPTLADIRAAAARIGDGIHRTPVMSSRGLDDLTGARLFFKCEAFQRSGSFKLRGALNAVLSLDEEAAARGLVTHSSGNFAAALSLAASIRGVPATVVMPEGSSAVKVEAVRAYGGKVVPCEPTLAARESTAERVQAETGASFLHPYNDHRVIAGQGTAALELLEQEPELDALLIPVGGGGLAGGSCLAASALSPGIALYGAEPAGADDAKRSLDAGRIILQTDPRTLADGLRTSLGDLTFPILKEHLSDILLAGEEEIVAAMRLIWQRMKILVEPSAAVPLAALLAHPPLFAGQRVGLMLSGGNLDLDRLPWAGA